MLFAGRDNGFIAFSLTSVGTPARTAAKKIHQIGKSIAEDSSIDYEYSRETECNLQNGTKPISRIQLVSSIL